MRLWLSLCGGPVVLAAVVTYREVDTKSTGPDDPLEAKEKLSKVAAVLEANRYELKLSPAGHPDSRMRNWTNRDWQACVTGRIGTMQSSALGM
jgi:hypothetical protein